MRKIRQFLIFALAFILANAPVAQNIGPWSPYVPFTVLEARAGDLQFLKGSSPFQDANGDPLAGGKVYFYDAVTANDRTVYQDEDQTIPHTQPIVLDSAGRFPASVYIPTGDWKIQVDTSADVTIFTDDNIQGALDTTLFSTEFAKPEEPVVSVTTTRTLLCTEAGKVFNADPTGGTFTITLPDAVSCGNGAEFTVRTPTSTNSVSVRATGGQTIDDGTVTSVTTATETLRLVSNGANWVSIVKPILVPGSVDASSLDENVNGRLQVAGQIFAWSTGSCPAGSLLMDGSNRSRSTYAELFTLWGVTYGNGDGSTTFGTPNFQGRFLRATDNAAGVDPDAGTRTDRGDGTTGDNVGTLQGEQVDAHTHADGTYSTANESAHTHGDGTYAAASDSHTHALPKRDFGGSFATSDGTRISEGNNAGSTDGNFTTNSDAHTHDVTGTSGAGSAHNHDVTGASASTGGSETRPVNINVNWCVFASAAEAAGISGSLNTLLNGAGVPSSGDGNDGDVFFDTQGQDYYLKVSGSWVKQASIVGPHTGSNWTFSSSTDTATDPGSGFARLNNATLGSVTQIAVSETDANAALVAGLLATWDDSTSTIKAQLRLQKNGDPTVFGSYNLTAISDQGDFYQLTVAATASAGTLSADDDISITVSITGDIGSQGTAGPTVAVGWTFDSATADADPGNGEFRLNNALPASATEGYFDNLEIGGSTITGWLDSWDDGGSASVRGTLTLVDASDSTVFAVYDVTGSIVDGTGYRKVTLSHLSSNGTFAGEVGVLFAMAGGAGGGDVTGPGSSTNLAIATWNGTGGDTLADSATTIIDEDSFASNSATAVPTQQSTKAYVDGSVIGQQTIWIPGKALTPRLTNGCAVGSSETATNDIMLETCDFDDTTVEYAQFTVQMPKSWDGGSLIVQFVWLAADVTGDKSVVWGARAGCLADDGAADTALGTFANTTDANGGAANDVMISGETGAITPAGSPAGEQWCVLEFRRVGSSGSDNLTGDALLLGVKVHYTTTAGTDD